MIQIWTIAKLAWNHPIELEIVEAEPSYPLFKKIEPPIPELLRPRLKPFASCGGIASLVIRGRNTVMPVAVLVGENSRVIWLPQPPNFLSPRSDGGVWVLNSEELVHYDSMGVKVRRLKILGNKLFGVREDAVWVVGYGSEVWFVNAEGKMTYVKEWDTDSSRFILMPQKASLCQSDRSQPSQLKCLDPDGKEHLVSLSFSVPPHEQLLSCTDDQILTLDILALKYYDASGVTYKLDVDNAGLTAGGEAFVSISTDEDWVDLYFENGTVQRIPSKYENSRGSLQGVTISAVEKDSILLTNFWRAIRYRGDSIETSFSVDPEHYRKDVFPHIWNMKYLFLEPTVTPDGTVILSTNGPYGMALIGLRWYP